MGKKLPKIGDNVVIHFAGTDRIGVICEIVDSCDNRQYVVLSKGIYYPCLTLDTSKFNYIIKYTPST